MSAAPVLELATCARPTRAHRPVNSVAGVSLALYPGERLAVVGPSGSGKTTLVHLMAALERPTSGTVRVAGHDVSQLADGEASGLRAHLLGVIFQQFFLLDALSAVQNVAAGLLYCGIAARQRPGDWPSRRCTWSASATGSATGLTSSPAASSSASPSPAPWSGGRP